MLSFEGCHVHVPAVIRNEAVFPPVNHVYYAQHEFGDSTELRNHFFTQSVLHDVSSNHYVTTKLDHHFKHKC